MPVIVSFDTSSSTDAEFSEFLNKHGDIFSSDIATFEYTSPTAPPRVSQADVYREMMQSVRYYGTIRYVLFPLFLTLTAVLAAQLYKDEYAVPRHLLVWAGLASSLAWGVFEYSLSESMRITWKQIVTIIGNEQVFAKEAVNPVAHRSGWITVPARLMFYGIYAIIFGFWLCQLGPYCVCLLG